VKTIPIPIATVLSTATLGFLFCLNSAPVRAQEAPPAAGTTASNPAQKPETAYLKPPPAFGLEDGTPVRLKLTRNLSSADATVGERVDFEVLDEIKVKDVIVIPRGSIAWATVTEAQPKRRMGRGGKLNVNIDSVRLTDGEKAPLRAVKEAQGGSHVGAMSGAIVASAIVFFPAAPFFLFMHGKDITIPEGTEIAAYINGDTPLDPARFIAQGSGAPALSVGTAPQAASGAPQPIAKPPDSEVTPVEVKSTPDGAEISIDGKFVGNTPSSFRLAPGDHTVRIEKSGYKPWEKAFTVLAGGQLTLNATLEPQ